MKEFQPLKKVHVRLRGAELQRAVERFKENRAAQAVNFDES